MMSDETINCADCKSDFVWTEGEQQFFEQKAFKKPRRCRECRQKRRADREQGSGGSTP